MGKRPLNLADDGSITERIDGSSSKGKQDALDGHGNYAKISGFATNNGKSQNYSMSHNTGKITNTGSKKKGIAPKYGNGAVKKALNIVTR